MPPRHAYWTIILEGKPTAFRAHTPEELAPTLRQLQARHPDAVMKWFARGRLWESPEQERDTLHRRGDGRDRRGPAWRPGGEHRDPRDRFKVPRDDKRRRFADRMRRDRFEPQQGEGRSGEKPRGPRTEGPTQRPDRPARPARPPQRNRDRTQGPAGDSPNTKPFDPPRGPARPPSRPPGDRKPFGPPRPGGPAGAGADRKPGPRAGRGPGNRPSDHRKPLGPPRGRRPDGPRGDRNPSGPPAGRGPGRPTGSGGARGGFRKPGGGGGGKRGGGGGSAR